MKKSCFEHLNRFFIFILLFNCKARDNTNKKITIYYVVWTRLTKVGCFSWLAHYIRFIYEKKTLFWTFESVYLWKTLFWTFESVYLWKKPVLNIWIGLFMKNSVLNIWLGLFMKKPCFEHLNRFIYEKTLFWTSDSVYLRKNAVLNIWIGLFMKKPCFEHLIRFISGGHLSPFLCW